MSAEFARSADMVAVFFAAAAGSGDAVFADALVFAAV